MKTLACVLTFGFFASLGAGQTVAQVAYQAPLDSQVHGNWNCMNNGVANIDVQGTDAEGNYIGIGYFYNFACRLRVHSGRGGGVILISACADVVWDPSGLLLSVTPFAQSAGAGARYAPPCTP